MTGVYVKNNKNSNNKNCEENKDAAFWASQSDGMSKLENSKIGRLHKYYLCVFNSFSWH